MNSFTTELNMHEHRQTVFRINSLFIKTNPRNQIHKTAIFI